MFWHRGQSFKSIQAYVERNSKSVSTPALVRLYLNTSLLGVLDEHAGRVHIICANHFSITFTPFECSCNQVPDDPDVHVIHFLFSQQLHKYNRKA